MEKKKKPTNLNVKSMNVFNVSHQCLKSSGMGVLPPRHLEQGQADADRADAQMEWVILLLGHPEGEGSGDVFSNQPSQSILYIEPLTGNKQQW